MSDSVSGSVGPGGPRRLTNASHSSAGIGGETRLAGVIGWPVRHSLSPALHNAALEAAGLDWRYLAFAVPPGSTRDAVTGMRTLGIEGLSVTMPHKSAMVAAVDRCTSDATALRAVNCVYRDGDTLVGDNTDGGGFVDSLRDADVEVNGRRVVVIGAGGAARAVIRAVANAGAAEVAVGNRNAGRAAIAAGLAGGVGRVIDGDTAHADALGAADLVVQATPVGMGDDGGAAFDVDALAEHAVVADLVYHPRVTPVLAAAADRGLRTVGGLGMLLHQAARAFERWTGVVPDLHAMGMAVTESAPPGSPKTT